MEIGSEQQRWRERMLRGLSWAAFSAVTFAAAWFAIMPHGAALLAQALVVTSIVLGIVTLHERLPFAIRAWTLLGALHLGCSAGMAVSGFSPNPFIGYGTVVVSATLLFGQTAGLTTVAAVTFTVVILSLAHRAGIIHRAPDWQELLDSTLPANLVRVVGIFSLLSATSVVGISYLLKRSRSQQRPALSLPPALLAMVRGEEVPVLRAETGAAGFVLCGTEHGAAPREAAADRWHGCTCRCAGSTTSLVRAAER